MRNTLLKFTLTVGILLAGTSLFAQRKVYCELLGTQKFLSSKVTVQIDFGQESSIWKSRERILDENGKAKSFNSMVDAMNFMGTVGWEFEQAYIVTTNNQNVYHWLLSKYIDENEDITDGINIGKHGKKNELNSQETPPEEQTEQEAL